MMLELHLAKILWLGAGALATGIVTAVQALW